MTVKEGKIYLNNLIDKGYSEEPVFILRGRDTLSSDVVLLWARSAEISNVNEEKVCSAIKISHEMAQWANKRLPD